MRCLPLVLIAVLASSLALAAELPLQPYSYTEGFEKDMPPIVLWASRGSAPTINFLGLSEDRAFEGHRSLKIDVTFGDSGYYYFGLPLRIPCAGKLVASARLWVADGNQNTVGFGFNMIYPPTSYSGCWAISGWNKPTGEWKLIQEDLVPRGREGAAGVLAINAYGVKADDVAVMVDRWSLFLNGEPGKRVIAYLDDIRIEGQVPEEKAYLAQAQQAFTASRAAFDRDLQSWEEQLAKSQGAVAASADHAAEAPQLVASIKAADARVRELLTKFRKDKYAGPAEVSEVQRALLVLQHWPEALAALTEARTAGRKYLVAPCNSPTLAFRKSGTEITTIITGAKTLACGACAGEYEAVSTLVYALQDTPAVRVTASALKGAAGSIPASAIDLSVVKSWYQGASTNIGYTPKRWLIPELLLKDDRLVRVDPDKQDNYVRSTAPDGTETYLICTNPDSSNLKNVRPIDAATLQPVDVKAGDSREFWLTLHVPDNARPGVYQGEVIFDSPAGVTKLPLQLTVYPFALQPSRPTYSIYYRGVLSADGKPTISSEGKSVEQYRAEMADLKAHGVLYPTNYIGGPEARLRQALDIRREVGLPTDHFYNLGYGVGGQPESQIPDVQKQVRWWMDLLRPYGYRDVYFYGIDEATGERLASQLRVWAAVQAAGGKTFVACYKGTFEAMGKSLNTAVLAGPPDPAEGQKYHSVGSQAFCYANPQVGVEDPRVYRRNFGLVLWKAGFDGAMDYAYQHSFGHIWNDFDDKTYRDHTFSYPTVSGVIDTIAWEGFREAVDDVRYVTTLEKAIREASPAHRKDAAAAKQWLAALDPATGDLDSIRAEMVKWLMRLR